MTVSDRILRRGRPVWPWRPARVTSLWRGAALATAVAVIGTWAGLAGASCRRRIVKVVVEGRDRSMIQDQVNDCTGDRPRVPPAELEAVVACLRRVQAHGATLRRSDATVAVEDPCVDQVRLEVVVRQERRSREPIVRPRLPFPWLHRLGLDELRSPRRGYWQDGPVAPTFDDFLDGFLGLRHRFTDATYRGGPRDRAAVSAALELRTFDTDDATPVLGVDLGLGAGLGGDAAYRATLYFGRGLGVVPGLVLVGGAGLGIDGVGEKVPPALVLPLEGRAVVDVEDLGRLQLVGRIAAVPTSQRRRGGTFRLPFADEAGLRLDYTLPETDLWEELRPRLGFELAEEMGTPLYVVTVGIGGVVADWD